MSNLQQRIEEGVNKALALAASENLLGLKRKKQEISIFY
jgi:hypothetical protein